MIRNELKQNINKIQKCTEKITTLEQKKQSIVDENLKIETDMPEKDRELQKHIQKKKEAEQDFERIEMQVREITENLRKEKEKYESELQPKLTE